MSNFVIPANHPATSAWIRLAATLMLLTALTLVTALSLLRLLIG
ncbi:hypothetical protein [Undibacterium sp. Ren11W]